MIREYSQKQICAILLEISKATDINTIKAKERVKDILPNIDSELADWRVGAFLSCARRDLGYRQYYTFLKNLGLNMGERRTISKLVTYCEAIDNLVKTGVDINTIPTTAMMSDYVVDYAQDDIKIGQLLANARFNRVGKIIKEKLIEHNFDFTGKLSQRREELKKIIIDISKVTDINMIQSDKVVKDFISDYPETLANYKIGRLVQNARKGDYEELKDVLIEAGFTFKAIKKRHTNQYICRAIDMLLSNGVDINNVPHTAMMSDYIPSYKEDDICIGEVFRTARSAKAGKVIKSKLEENGFDFARTDHKREEKIKILREIAKVSNINKVKNSYTVKDILPDYKGLLENWQIGAYLAKVRTRGDAEYKDLLLELGFVFGVAKNNSHSVEFICQAIKDLANNGVNLNEIPLRANMSKYLPDYKKDDYHIGYILSQARRGLVGDKIKSELEKYNFDFNIKINPKWNAQKVSQI